MKKIIAVLLAFTTITGCIAFNSVNGIKASDVQAENEEKDPVRVLYQDYLNQGLVKLNEKYPEFTSLIPQYVKFGFCDINNSGTEELILQRFDENLVYAFDPGQNIVCELPTDAEFYKSGYATIPLYVNKKLSGSSFSPIQVYGYNSEANKYEKVADADCWSKDFKQTDSKGNSFPDEADKDGNGFVYYLSGPGYDSSIPVDDDVYAEWKSFYLGSGEKHIINFTGLSQENIDSINTSLNRENEETTPAVTSPAETTTETYVTTTVSLTEPPVSETTASSEVTSETTAETSASFENSRCDIDRNSVINTADLVRLIQILTDSKSETNNDTQGDVNGDGKVDSKDLMVLTDILSK